MNYLELNITIKQNLEKARDISLAELNSLGYESFMETDSGLKAYIKESLFDINAVNELIIFNSDEFTGSIFETTLIEDINWNARWESSFEPVEVSDFCYIRSTHHPESYKHSYELIVEPKMSFGTGHHATTWLMINMMKELDILNKEVLDMGCGTGVLSILASKIGASRVVGVDIDEWAYRNSIENLKINSASNCEIILGDISAVQGESHDIILANITRNILLEDIPDYSKICRIGGNLVLSGFYESDNAEIINRATDHDFLFIDKKIKDNWSSLLFIRKG